MKPNALARVPDDAKFRELILLIAEQSERDHSFGATKLNKLLFYADFVAFLTLGQAITWHRYQKLNNGPAPRVLIPITERMKAEGEIAVSERTYYGMKQKRTIALREPNLNVFSGPEVALVMKIIEDSWGKSAREMTQLSHAFIGWQLAGEGEDIPYEVALIDTEEPSPEETARGIALEPMAKECLTRHGT